MKNIQVLLILFVLLSSCCKNYCKDDELQIVKKDYTGDALRMNGFYYSKNGALVRSFLVPYRNANCILSNYPVDIDRLVRDLDNNSGLMSGIRKRKTSWGLIEIQNDTLKVDYWGIAKCERPLERGFFKILNDTTLLNFKNTSMRDMKDYFVSDTFYFQYLSSKPDSTNEYIR